MLAVDTNLLVYAHRREASLGEHAHRVAHGSILKEYLGPRIPTG